LRLWVDDTGGGVAPADVPHVFEPFYTTKRGGTGLGLAIARNIVEGLGGTIAVASGIPAGTDVCISLPSGPLPGADKADA
jgi:signal transduction histidine kinase